MTHEALGNTPDAESGRRNSEGSGSGFKSFEDMLVWGGGGGGGAGGPEPDSSNCRSAAKCSRGIKKPINCEGLAPWVVCDFVQCSIKGDTVAATVGGFDKAAMQESLIKSFSYGFTDGASCKLEIFDRKGSQFAYFFERLNKDHHGANKNYTMKIRFGWTCSTCTGLPGSSFKGATQESQCRYFMPHTIQKTYEKGAFKYIIEGIDTMQTVFQGEEDKVQGQDDKKMLLKEAIIKLWQEHKPPVAVSFVRKIKSDQVPAPLVTIEKPFVTTDGKEPEGTWKTDARDPMSATADWKKDYKTDKGRGLTPRWDNSTGTPSIKYVEQGCGEGKQNCAFCYIVNGGKLSPVISFNPEINWPFQAAEMMGGGAGSTETGKSNKRTKDTKGDCEVIKQEENVGERTAVPPSDSNVIENEGPENAQEASDGAINAHTSANRTTYPITAEMRVQGDPEMDGPLEWVNQKIAIVVINPFHPVEHADKDFGVVFDWLATPVCNPIFTSKEWIIESVHHDIKEGSFVTTIKMYLVGSELPTGEAGAPAGGAP